MKTKYIDHETKNIKIDIILERDTGTREVGGYDAAQWENGNGWGDKPEVSYENYDYVRISHKNNGKFIKRIETKEAEKLYGVVPNYGKKIWIHIFCPCEFTDYNNN